MWTHMFQQTVLTPHSRALPSHFPSHGIRENFLHRETEHPFILMAFTTLAGGL